MRHFAFNAASFLVGSTVLAACSSGPAIYLPVIMTDSGTSPPPATCPDGGACDATVPPVGGCDASVGSCLAAGSVGPGKPCSFTSDCKGNDYCGDDGTCDPAGSGLVGSTCTTSGSCVRGAVCYKATPGLYGVCALPDGTSITESADGGIDGATEGGVVHGPAGTAHGVGGAC